jgi:molybdopterin synthase sulfur carrier subunit
VQINLYATFRLIAGVKNINVDLPEGSTILEAVKAAVMSYPVLKKHWFDSNNDLHAHVHVFYNGADAIILPQGFNTPIGKNDTLDIFPPVSGGSI